MVPRTCTGQWRHHILLGGWSSRGQKAYLRGKNLKKIPKWLIFVIFPSHWKRGEKVGTEPLVGNAPTCLPWCRHWSLRHDQTAKGWSGAKELLLKVPGNWPGIRIERIMLHEQYWNVNLLSLLLFDRKVYSFHPEQTWWRRVGLLLVCWWHRGKWKSGQTWR